jgi:hypothetical protein
LKDLDLDGAAADFNKALELKKDYAFAYKQPIIGCNTKEKLRGIVINDCTTAIGLNPNTAKHI